ncbi:MAG: hypothetical protein ABII22_01745 [Candidatus Micrarchaeota archaeon]
MKKTIMITPIILVFCFFLFGCLGPAPKECGTDNACFSEAVKTCSPANGKSIESSGTIEATVKGYEADKCVIYFKITESPELPALKDKDMTCKFPKEYLTSENPWGISSKGEEWCTGSFIDYLKTLTMQ